MNWSPQQDTALQRVRDWLARKSAPFFYLAGYAGTGKTTLARHFAEDAGNVLFGSFTGKAAAVMRDKGCTDATTIHRLIYRNQEKGQRHLKELQEELRTAPSARHDALRSLIREEIKAVQSPSFHLNHDSDVRRADLVVIDECSMINESMGVDLLSFGTPVLVLGDPAQLPPVYGGGFFTDNEPDMMLTEVHRQARESAILELATQVREGKAISYGNWPDAQVISREDLDPASVPEYDQLLVGKRKTRYLTNVRYRELVGRKSPLPEPGDRLVCLRNSHERGLLNGEMWNTLESVVLDDEKLELAIENPSGETMRVEAWQHPFTGDDGHDYAWGARDVQKFDYGYVLTTHKAQGSQWPRVIVFDQSACFRQNAARWLYTAITRASKYLTVIR